MSYIKTDGLLIHLFVFFEPEIRTELLMLNSCQRQRGVLYQIKLLQMFVI